MIFYIILKEGDLMYKLLIVEDDFIIAKGLQKHFEKYHYDVQYIEDFEHVLDDFLAFQPDLVLLDIHLPFLMVIIGVKKFEKYHKSLLFLFPPLMKI